MNKKELAVRQKIVNAYKKVLAEHKTDEKFLLETLRFRLKTTEKLEIMREFGYRYM